MATIDVNWSRRGDGGALDLEIFKRKSWTGVSAHFVKIAAPVTYDFQLRSPLNYVALHDFYRVDGETRVDGLPRSTAKDLRNKLSYIPAGCEVEGWTKIEKPASIIIVMLGPSVAGPPTVDLAKLSPRTDFDDPMLRSLMVRFQAILDDASLDTPGYAETLAELLAHELARTTGTPKPSTSTQAGLSTSQIQLVTEYMDSHLSEKTSISELAALVDLTRFHFIRAFKQSAGVPPHQFMIRRRVDRAKEMLSEEEASIAEIAERTGFGSPVQMTRAFRRMIGTTPSAFRRNDC